MSQLSIDFAREQGKQGMQRAEKRASKSDADFTPKACTAAIAYLRTQPNYEASGEQIVLGIKQQGIRGSGDDRCFGAVISSLRRTGQIVYVRDVPRVRGHGTRGGSLYRLDMSAAALSELVAMSQECGLYGAQS